MSPVLVAIVLAICAGAVAAVSTREPAAGAIGLAVALVGAALLADPLPSAGILGVRVIAGLLAATLVRWAARGGPRQFSAIGWPSEALMATAGAIAGLGIAVTLASVAAGAGGPVFPGGPGPIDGPVGPGIGPGVASGGITSVAATWTMALTLSAATALFVLGAPPLVHGQTGIRRAVGLVLVAQSVLLLRIAIAGSATDLEEVARAGLLVACAATGAALARATARVHAGTEREAPA